MSKKKKNKSKNTSSNVSKNSNKNTNQNAEKKNAVTVNDLNGGTELDEALKDIEVRVDAIKTKEPVKQAAKGNKVVDSKNVENKPAENKETKNVTSTSQTSSKEKPKKKFNAFSGFLIAYVALLVIMIVVGLAYIWRLLIDYEAAMPDVNMEKFMVEFQSDSIDDLLEKYPVTVSEYNTKQDVKEYYEKLLAGNELSYRKLTGKYTNKTPVYEIMAGESVIASASLTEVGKSKYNFSVWDMTEVNFNDYLTEKQSCRIKVPASAQLTVDGNPIDEKYFVEEEEIELTKNIADFVENVPAYRIYEITDLIKAPKIGATGDRIELAEEEGFDIAYLYKQDDVLKLQVQDRIFAMAHSYGTYIINRGSLAGMMSYMVGKAREYVSDIPAVWAYLYGQQYTYAFTDEEISNFVQYNDDCFSCDVNFKLNVVYGGRSISYDTHFKCMYVKQWGEWYLADFILENE